MGEEGHLTTLESKDTCPKEAMVTCPLYCPGNTGWVLGGVWGTSESAYWWEQRSVYLSEVSQQSLPGPLVSMDGCSMTTQAEDWDTKSSLVCEDIRG